MEHFLFYREYTQANNRTMCLMVNPMRNNWFEMPEFIRFVNKHNINIWFNTIHRPIEWSVWALPHDELVKIHAQLNGVEFTKADRSGSLSTYNIGIYKNLVGVQIKNWVSDAKERETRAEVSTAVITEADAKELFEKKIADYLYAKFNEGEEQKKYRLQLLLEKVKQTDKLLIERNGSVDFFKILSESPADIVYQQFETRSLNSLVEDFENRHLAHT
jgi:hypothetical protein